MEVSSKGPLTLLNDRSKYYVIRSLQFDVYVLPTYDLVYSDFTEGLSNGFHLSSPVAISIGPARYDLSSSRTVAQCAMAGEARPKRAVRHPGIIESETKLIFKDFFFARRATANFKVSEVHEKPIRNLSFLHTLFGHIRQGKTLYFSDCPWVRTLQTPADEV